MEEDDNDMRYGITHPVLSLLLLLVLLTVVAYPQPGMDYKLRGDSLAAAGKLEAAAEAYRVAYSEDESNLDILHGLADVSTKLGDLGAAMQSLQLIAETDRNDVEAYLSLAKIGWLTGEFETGMKDVEFAEVVSISPDDRIPAYRATILRGMGELVDAESVLVDAFARFPNSAMIQTNLGLVRATTKGPRVGFDHLWRAFEIDSNDVNVLSALGNLYFASGLLDSASMFFERALELEPHNYFMKQNFEQFNRLTDQTEVHRLMSDGVRFFEKALYSRARKAFSDAIALDSNFFEAYLNLGFTHNLLGEPRKAVAVFEKAAELGTTSAPLYIGWGNALAVVGQLDEAIDKYKHALAIDSTITEVHDAIRSVSELNAAKESGER